MNNTTHAKIAYLEGGKPRVEQLKEFTKNWSNGATLYAISEELRSAPTLEERFELMAFKNEILEIATFGKLHSIENDNS